MDTRLLKARMVQMGMTQGRVAKLIGMSAQSMSRKLTGKRDFTLSEAVKLKQVLDISDAGTIFFGDLIPYTQRVN